MPQRPKRVQRQVPRGAAGGSSGREATAHSKRKDQFESEARDWEREGNDRDVDQRTTGGHGGRWSASTRGVSGRRERERR